MVARTRKKEEKPSEDAGRGVATGATTAGRSAGRALPRSGARAGGRKDDHVRARVETAIKSEAEAVLAAIGLTVSDAMRLMLHRIVAERRLPFEPLIPNEKTIAAIRASRRGDVTVAGRPADLMAALEAD